MSRNAKSIRRVFYSLAGLAGLGCAVWLVFALRNDGNEAISHSQIHGEFQTPAISFNDDKPSIEHNLSQPENALEQVEEVANDGSGHCSLPCSSALSMLDQDLELDDDTFRRLGAHVNEIAAYLQNDDSKRQHYLELALTTPDGDKRSFLTDIFRHLPYQQKVELGGHFIASENWRIRANGVTLIADDDALTQDVANALMSVFSSEENAYVKGKLLSHLNQSSTLQGDTGILYQLDSVIYNGTDSSVRVAALKAKMRLSEQPHHILTDAVQALRTSEPEFQLAGLIAIDQILAHESQYIENGAYIDKVSIKNDIDNIRNQAVYNNDNQHFDHLIREANAIYVRYFQQY